MMTMMRNAATDKASPFKGSAAARDRSYKYTYRAFVWTRNTHHHSHR